MRLLLSDAIVFVRARLDELSYSNDDMILPADDDRNFDETVEKLMPEAAEAIFRNAPAELMEPELTLYVDVDGTGLHNISPSDDDILWEGGLSDKVAKIILRTTTGLLRVVSITAKNSGIFFTEAKPFDSVEARVQTNKYTRGTFDAPVLVKRPVPGGLEYKYYSIHPEKDVEGFYIGVLRMPKYVDEGTDTQGIFCPDRLGTAVLNRLTGMVLEAYKETQLAGGFYEKSSNYIS